MAFVLEWIMEAGRTTSYCSQPVRIQGLKPVSQNKYYIRKEKEYALPPPYPAFQGWQIERRIVPKIKIYENFFACDGFYYNLLTNA
jgi:hypothetical protein